MNKMFTVIAQHERMDWPGVFRTPGRGFRHVRTAFESAGFTIIKMHADTVESDDYSDAFAAKGWEVR